MEVPTPPNAHPALRPTEPYSRPTERYAKDKRAFVTWATGVLAAACVAGIGWVGTHVLAAESVNEKQAIQIEALDKRAEEDRAIIREQQKETSSKLDRIMERLK